MDFPTLRGMIRAFLDSKHFPGGDRAILEKWYEQLADEPSEVLLQEILEHKLGAAMGLALVAGLDFEGVIAPRERGVFIPGLDEALSILQGNRVIAYAVDQDAADRIVVALHAYNADPVRMVARPGFDGGITNGPHQQAPPVDAAAPVLGEDPL